MTITRIVNGETITFSLTERELIDAYFEQEHSWDVSFVRDWIPEYFSEEDSEERYGCRITLGEVMSCADLLAYAYRKNVSDHEMTSFDALNDALERFCVNYGYGYLRKGRKNMTYSVTYRIDGRWTTDVEASSVDEAKEKAQAYFEAADIGSVEIVDSAPVIVEDEDDIVWEA